MTRGWGGGVAVDRYCSNECQAAFHIENGTSRAKEFRAEQNARRVCWDWNRGRECTPYCKQYGWRHACQACGANCAKSEGRHLCSSCAPAE